MELTDFGCSKASPRNIRTLLHSFLYDVSCRDAETLRRRLDKSVTAYLSFFFKLEVNLVVGFPVTFSIVTFSVGSVLDGYGLNTL